MTVVDATSHLFNWFAENDCFCFENNFKDLIFVTNNIEEDKACFLCALEDLEKTDLVRSSEVKGKKYWTLKKSFDAYGQTVTITHLVANRVATIINTFCETIDDRTDECDPKGITENDIKNLTFICEHFAKSNKDKDSI